MNLFEAGKRAEELRRKIVYNSRLYYENDAPEISDYEYDMMFRELSELEEKYPGRRFTPDGHLVGSIGEVYAAEKYGLALLETGSEKHDARSADGRLIQIKITQTDRVSIYSEPDYLIVMKMKNELGIPHVRVAGELDKKCTKIALCFGTPGGVSELLREEAEIVLTGEASEWKLSEYARDAALLGVNKALIVIGHIGSEAGGMIVLAQDLAEKYPDLDVKYFESGAVYHDI